jgi:hypothetical protein
MDPAFLDAYDEHLGQTAVPSRSQRAHGADEFEHWSRIPVTAGSTPCPTPTSAARLLDDDGVAPK